jgi:hypothetical protein
MRTRKAPNATDTATSTSTATAAAAAEVCAKRGLRQ